jgi:hypothetical protein
MTEVYIFKIEEMNYQAGSLISSPVFFDPN